MTSHREPVGDFYVKLVRTAAEDGSTVVDREMTSSPKLLSYGSGGKPTVIHFYDGG